MSLKLTLAAAVLIFATAGCQITGTAPPASADTTGMNSLGGPGSHAP